MIKSHKIGGNKGNGIRDFLLTRLINTELNLHGLTKIFGWVDTKTNSGYIPIIDSIIIGCWMDKYW